MINYADVQLLPVERAKHLSFLVKCGNDQGLYAQQWSKRKTSVLEQERKLKESSLRSDYFIYVIVGGGENRGVCEVLDVDWVNSSCKLHLYLEDRARNVPKFGSKVLNAVLNYLFNSLGLWKVWAEVELDDVVMMSLYKSYGFTQEVRKRNHAYTEGSYKTVVELGMLEIEFEPL
jgi:RimJ/RimL family protein N-acetyltransferase